MKNFFLSLAMLWTSAFAFSEMANQFQFQDQDGELQTITLDVSPMLRPSNEQKEVREKSRGVVRFDGASQLTRADIEARDEQLGSIIRDQVTNIESQVAARKSKEEAARLAVEKYDAATLRNVVDFVERNFGTHIYHAFVRRRDMWGRRAFPSNDRAYYMRMHGIVDFIIGSPRSHSYRAKSPSQLYSKYDYSNWSGDGIIGWPRNISRPWYADVYTEIRSKSYKKPANRYKSLRHFADELAASGLKSFNATVVIGKGHRRGGSDVQVIYPVGHPWFRIPQPVVIIGQYASRATIRKMITKHAPLIYSYNSLVQNQLIDSVGGFIHKLTKHPSMTPVLEKGLKAASRYNRTRIVLEGLLMVNYAVITGAAAITGGAIVTAGGVAAAGIGAAAGATAGALALTAPIWGPPVAGAAAAVAGYSLAIEGAIGAAAHH